MSVVADDLTGAADCGIAFALAGLPTFVALTEGEVPGAARVVAFDTGTRALPAEAAAQRTEAAVRRAYAEGTRHLYKKIDSTLRGQVGPETAAALRAAREARGSAVAIAAPAFPALGRTMRDGRILVEGDPLEETEVWHKSGMSGRADLRAMLETAGLRVAIVGPGEEPPAGVDAAVCDAASDEDLRRIAGMGARLEGAVIWVGSGGLARHLPEALGLRPQEDRLRIQKRPGPVLTLIGSRSSISREQAQRLCAGPGALCIELSPGELLQRSDLPEARRALDAGQDVTLLIGLGEVDLEAALPLAAALGRLAAPLTGAAAGVIATGGDIARGLLAGLGSSGLWMAGEVEPGVPLGFTDARLPLITKAGAFGDPQTLVRCRAALRSA